MAGVKKITINDVAHAAGVSVSTVSLVLSGKGRISSATGERVNQAIALVKAVISHHISRDGRAESDFSQIFGIGFVAVRVFVRFHTTTGSRIFFFNLKRHTAK